MSTKKVTADHSLFPNALKEADVKDNAPVAAQASEAAAKQPVDEPKITEDFKEFIVVVDDSAPNLVIVSGILKKFAFGSLQFKDGQMAIEFLRKAKKEDLAKIKAVFSDFMMPNLDGLGLLRELRKAEEIKHLPFVMFTSNADRNVIREAGSMGVHGYILKPITTAMIAEKVATLFPGRVAFTNPAKATNAK